ncbi:MAG TPA: DNA primase [Geobacteraceae bacterium]|nr:DNA primase [Geobacteraceae bacterium]
MMIPDEKIAEVRERAGIVEVISDYISLKKSGANFQGLCPFHGEKTPSFNVNPSRGIFHCFGCGEGGNAVTFVMKMEGISFPEAVKLLAKRVGVEIDDRPPTLSEIKRKDEKEQQLGIIAAAAGYYARVLKDDPAGDAGRRYLSGRGVEGEVVSSYRLGYASDRWDGLVTFLKQKGIAPEQVEKLGLIKSKSGGGYFDLFRNRLIFTIANVHGQPIGFGGRVLDNSLPKYINSPESPVYLKSEVLFGIDLARQSMREQRSAIIVEGYFDHLALYRGGITNVVATCGTALTKGHLQVLRRYADKLYLLFDSDSAGKKATFRAMELLLAEQVPCHVIELPAGDDPDSYLAKSSPEEFRELLHRALPVLDYYLRDLVSQEDTGTVAGKKAVVDRFKPLLQKLADPVERDLYLRELSRLLAIDLRTLGAGMSAAQSKPAASMPVRSVAGTAESIVALLFRYPEIVSEFNSSGVAGLLPPVLREIASKIVAAAVKNELIEYDAIIGQAAERDELRTLAALLVDDAHLADIDPHKALRDFSRALERETLKMVDVKSLQRELQQLDSESPRYREILELLDSLRNRKSQLSL